jgi:hypothetical protein
MVELGLGSCTNGMITATMAGDNKNINKNNINKKKSNNRRSAEILVTERHASARQRGKAPDYTGEIIDRMGLEDPSVMAIRSAHKTSTTASYPTIDK